jgi:hypothetical protein
MTERWMGGTAPVYVGADLRNGRLRLLKIDMEELLAPLSPAVTA